MVHSRFSNINTNLWKLDVGNAGTLAAGRNSSPDIAYSLTWKIRTRYYVQYKSELTWFVKRNHSRMKTEHKGWLNLIEYNRVQVIIIKHNAGSSLIIQLWVKGLHAFWYWRNSEQRFQVVCWYRVVRWRQTNYVANSNHVTIMLLSNSQL